MTTKEKIEMVINNSGINYELGEMLKEIMFSVDDINFPNGRCLSEKEINDGCYGITNSAKEILKASKINNIAKIKMEIKIIREYAEIIRKRILHQLMNMKEIEKMQNKKYRKKQWEITVIQSYQKLDFYLTDLENAICEY